MANSGRRGSAVDRTGVRPRWAIAAAVLLALTAILAAIAAKEASNQSVVAVVPAVAAVLVVLALAVSLARSLSLYRDRLEIETAVFTRSVVFEDLRSIRYLAGLWFVRWRGGFTVLINDRHVGRVLGQLVTRVEEIRVSGRRTLTD